MKTPNLIVVVNEAESTLIHETFPAHKLLTDIDIFEFLNFRAFCDRMFGLDSMEELCDAFVEYSKETPLVIHTFHPVIQNYLGVYDENTNLIHSECKERFMINKDGEFVSLFEIDNFVKKLDILAVGDAIFDVYLQAEVENLGADCGED